MAKGDWWFKFEWKDWRGDPALNRCSLETQGFWLRCLCAMYESQSAELVGTSVELSRMIGCFPEEFMRCALELKRTETADVTIGNGDVTLLSRRLQRELNEREHIRLRVQKHRGNGDVTVVKRDRVKSKSKEKEIREEKEVAETAPQAPATTDRKKHPAIFAIWQVTGTYPPKEIWDDLIDRLGSEIDSVLLASCYRKWRARGYNKANYDWAVEWYVEGIPKVGKYNNGHGNHQQRKPTSNAAVLDQWSKFARE